MTIQAQADAIIDKMLAQPTVREIQLERALSAILTMAENRSRVNMPDGTSLAAFARLVLFYHGDAR